LAKHKKKKMEEEGYSGGCIIVVTVDQHCHKFLIRFSFFKMMDEVMHLPQMDMDLCVDN
jgi:hypothetical protein